MAAPSAYEQYILELVNRARLDPAAEARRLGISLNEGLPAGTISRDSKQPLAHNSELNDAASDHSLWMLATDRFSHTGVGGSNPGDRMEAAGYVFSGAWTWGENISWNGTTGTLNRRDSASDSHDGLFESPGHRTNILGEDFKEIGVGVETGRFNGYNAFMHTQKFAKSGTGNFITGVVYNDADGDDFYSVGEGYATNISFATLGTTIGSTRGWASGGYGFNTAAQGDVTATFTGSALAAPVSVRVVLNNENIKLDLIDGNHIQSSTDNNAVG